MPKGARPLTELLNERERWRAEVGKTFVAARGASGQSQEAFAEALGISQPYLSQIETGSRTPSDATLQRLMSITEGARHGDEDPQ